jgi:5,10-methylenetetrahydrofolate reductase
LLLLSERRSLGVHGRVAKEVGLSTVRGTKQLEMRFEGDNPLANCLRAGKFVVLLEVDSPPGDQPFESIVAMASSMAKRIAKVPEIVGMAVTDRMSGEADHDPVDTATRLAEASGKMPVLYVSGKGSEEDRVRDLFARAVSGGIRTVVAVTGDRSDRHDVPPNARRIPPYPTGYLDSVDILRLGRRSGQNVLLGAGVNPFKYNPCDQYLQFYKMTRKLQSGADFLVTHAGWDMRKLQELQWYLQMRDFGYPVLARLRLLMRDEIEALGDEVYPGVPVARGFAALLQRESNVNAAQSLAAQLHRLELQIVGCRLLGYSGVQIAGVRDIQTLDMVLARVAGALGSALVYADWVKAWNEFHNAIPFDPVRHAYCVFSRPLQPEQPMYDSAVVKLTARSLPLPTRGDRFRARLLPMLLSERAPNWVSAATRTMACRGWQKPFALLKFCHHLNPLACPKNLVYGPCGGSRPDGTCEFGHAPCFFHRVIALAAHRHELDRLEEGVPHD